MGDGPGAGEGGVDPAVGLALGLLHEPDRQVDEDLGPLATLRLVAGEGVAVAAVERIEVGILPEGLPEAP